LARYVFRVAITNNRIVGLDDETVTLRYKKRKSNRWRTCRITGEEFIRRFVQHVLPKGLHKVRYFGLWHPAKRALAARARLRLRLDRPAMPHPAETTQDAANLPADHTDPAEPRICPCCHTGHLVRVRRLTPKPAMGP
jgi:hypothetical protein